MDNGKTICLPIFQHGGIKIVVYKLFLFGRVQNLSFGKEFRFVNYQTYLVIRYVDSFLHNPEFNNPEKNGLIKTLWEKEKMLVTSMYSFSTRFSTLSQTITSFQLHLKCSLQMLSSSVTGFPLDIFFLAPPVSPNEKSLHHIEKNGASFNLDWS